MGGRRQGSGEEGLKGREGGMAGAAPIPRSAISLYLLKSPSLSPIPRSAITLSDPIIEQMAT